jgi:hypothetical protein
MKLIRSKKAVAVLLVALVVVAASAVGAYAYFTASGSGTGSATVGTSSALTISQTGSISGLTPNGPAASVAYTINNPSAKGAQNLGKVSISSVTVNNAPGCDAAANFTVTPAASAVGTIAAGGTFTSAPASQPSIQMLDTGVNQDVCQGASLSLALSAVAGS